jgi:hypothetical protein
MEKKNKKKNENSKKVPQSNLKENGEKTSERESLNLKEAHANNRKKTTKKY